MNELGIEYSLGVRTVEKTGKCVVLVTPDGERTMATCLGASKCYDESQISAAVIQNAEVFHFCGYQWDTAAQQQAIKKALQIAKQSGVLISFDVADPFVVQMHREDCRWIIDEYADIVFANQKETETLYETSAEEGARILQSKGLKFGLVKLGAQGALGVTPEDTFVIDPVATEVVDTTAAGDMFAGGFLSALVKGASPRVCGQVAATLAADVISRYGAHLSGEVLQRVQAKFF